MIVNPYRWQHDQPAHIVARDDLVGQIERHLRRGVAVKLVGGRGMGKSVLLRQVQARFAGESDTRAVLVPGPPEEGTIVACVQDIAMRLGLDPLTQKTMDAVMEAAATRGIERLILLVDEADQYVLLGNPGDLARAWFVVQPAGGLPQGVDGSCCDRDRGRSGHPPPGSCVGLGVTQPRGDLRRGAVRADGAATSG